MTTTDIEISLDAVIVAVTDNAPRLLTVAGPGGLPALPSGLLQPQDRTLELGLRRWVQEQTGLEVGYVEQLYTFGDRVRGADHTDPANRRLSIAYLALVREGRPSVGAAWVDFYDVFPWEDHRRGRPAIIDNRILEALSGFIGDGTGPDGGDRTGEDRNGGHGAERGRRGDRERARASRAERVQIVFGTGGAQFDGVRVLERYELLYEAGLLVESGPVRRSPSVEPLLESRSMYLDHRRIAATALGRIRGKLSYRPVVFELLPAEFTLLRLQQVVEALAGIGLHKGNFRRLVEAAGLVEGTGRLARTGGRPAELFRFRHEVLRERPRPGVGHPWVRA